MEARATARYRRVSPQKARLVADMIRNKPAHEALQILELSPRKGARIIKKVLDSALANAEENMNLDLDSLYVKSIYVDQGPQLKRWRPRAMGRAYGIQHKLSHITVVLDEY